MKNMELHTNIYCNISRQRQNMNHKTSVYHGTTAPGITKFKIGVKNKGETEEPVNAIWFGTRFEGARYHAAMVSGPIRAAESVYIYECTLHESCVIADTKRSRIPPRNFKKLVEKHLPWHMRLAYKMGGRVRRKFVPNYNNWFQYLCMASTPLKETTSLEASMNALIKVCKSIGVDILVHPSTTCEGSGLQHYDEGVYGEAMLVINSDKVTPHIQYKIGSA